MNKFNILYVDDRIDNYLSLHFVEKYKDFYTEYTFKEEDTYETILEIINLEKANLVIIDSTLFQNHNAGNKFTGEEFMMLLKKFNPFLEVIIITQNNETNKIGAFPKYRPGYAESEDDYFQKIDNLVTKCFKNLQLFQELSLKLENNSSFNRNTVEKIRNAVNGITDYDDLTKDDIDRLIKSFNAIRRGC